MVASALILLLTFSTTGFALGYSRLQGNIQQTTIDDYLGTDRPTQEAPDPVAPAAPRPLNVLVLASDSREGANAEIDSSATSDGMRSDTAMLVNISADRSHVNVVSIPRDTLVDIPPCTLPDGTVTAPKSDAMFNSAFAIGGQTGDVGSAAACSIRTVEKLTGIYIHEFVVVDFAGFISVVDALGGIAMYLPKDINDSASNLHIKAGCRLLDGETALGLARVRKIGDGSDISRIGRQQDIVMEMLDEALSTELLSDPIRLYKVLDVSTQTLTTSPDIGNIYNLIGLAGSLAGLRAEDIVMVTMPFDWAGNRVTVSAEFAPYLWMALRKDVPLLPVLSGAGYEIAQAGVPPWDPSLGLDALASIPPPPTANPTDAPSPGGSTNAPGDGATVVPDDLDPALTCTKETAS